jgi:PAS domain S-box-containing protein
MREDPRSTYAIHEHVNDAVIVVDSAKGIIYWNESAERIYGWYSDEVFGLSVSDIIPVLKYIDPHTSSEAVAATVRQDGAWRGKIVQLHRNGRLLTLDASVRLERDADGVAHGMIAVNRDITERSRHAAHAHHACSPCGGNP